jgi:hypothetical protein
VLSDLRSYERQVYSQGGEDGVLQRIFECIGTESEYFVEFGAWDGRHLSNTAHLRLDHGWSGLLLEGSSERHCEPVREEFVTVENIHSLFERYRVPERFDLLSIDIDGNEYWVWQALRDFHPRVVVIEYNVFFGTAVSKTMPYDPDHAWDKTYFHGASLAALRKLGREKGYSLVHTDSFAPNAFFVANSELPAAAIDVPIERIAAWAWDEPRAEPPLPAGRSWLAV